MNLFWLISSARAADYNLIQPLPGVQTVSGFPQYIESILPFILSLAAILAVIMVVIGGVEYAISLSDEGKRTARDRINNAILGLLLALVSYLILYTINPDLTKLKLDIQSLPTSATQQGVGTPSGGTTQPPTGGQPTSNIIPPPSNGPACPPGQNNTFCLVGENCVLDATKGTSRVCFSKTPTRTTGSKPENYCAASEDIGKNILGGKLDPNSVNCFGVQTQSGRAENGCAASGQGLCYVRQTGEPLPATGSH